ncbi:MAG: DUF4294 domain-containing protein [Chitinophagaceae bacterium]|nr:MAG: DUF4294 domain-containing protein [Chitinophagaceae bacterium]
MTGSVHSKFLLLLGLMSFVLSGNKAAGQSLTDTILVSMVIYNGDTIEAKTLDNVSLYARMTEAQRKAAAKYNRLRNAVYVTYPYARRAGAVMNDMNEKMENITAKHKRKEYIRSRENELKKEFTDPITNLSVYQGKVLMKLINRETGNNCYEIIKEYKGAVTARFYQTVAFFFNSNLKQSYDADTDDAMIEKIVLEVQRMYGYNETRKVAKL